MKYMELALEEAYKGIDNNEGGPFGSVIVKDGKVVGKGHNRVVLNNDPTCHGEMEAIRDACKNLNTFNLKGCTIYTTAEPCPMCFGAILWANIDKVYYGCNKLDTNDIGFRDNNFYEILQGKDTSFKMEELDRDKCLELFAKYKAEKRKTNY